MHYSPYNGGEVLPGYMFTDTGFWDTFRCLFPFLNLMYPSMNAKMQGRIGQHLQGERFPARMGQSRTPWFAWWATIPPLWWRMPG